MSRLFSNTSQNSIDASQTSFAKRFLSIALATVLMSTIVPMLAPTAANAAGSEGVTFHKGSGLGDDYTQISPPDSFLEKASIRFSKAGHVFAYWASNKNGEGAKYYDQERYPFSQANSDLYAQWSTNFYTITFNLTTNGGSSFSNETRPVATGSKLSSLPDELNPDLVVRPGYTFTGWFTTASGAGTQITKDTIPTASTTYYARWEVGAYTLTYNYNGATGGNSTLSNSYTTGGTAITLPTPTKTGYYFDGWYSNEALTNAISSPHTITENGTAYAKWSNVVTYTITFDATTNGGSAISPLTRSVNTGSAVGTLPTPAARPGYTHTGWFTTASSGGTQITSATVPASSTTYYARWAPGTFTLTYDYNDATGGDSKASDSYTTGGTAITLPTAATKTGYEFGGWYSNEALTNAISSPYTITADGTAYAKWNAGTYSVTYNNHDATTAQSGGDASYTTNNSFNFPTVDPAKDGYKFDGWFLAASGGSALGSSYTPLTPFGNIELHAQWTVTGRTVTFKANTGTGADYTQTSNNQTPLTLNTFTKTGYIFDFWSTNPTNGSEYNDGGDYPFSQSNSILYARWKVGTNTFSYDGNTSDGGSTPVGGGSKSYESTVTVAANTFTKTGYSFTGWNTEADAQGTAYAGTGSVTFTMPDAAVTLYAQWSRDIYTVTFDATTNGGSAISPLTTSVSSGDAVGTLPTPAARTGYTFTGWFKLASGGSSITGATVPAGSTTYYAQWNPNTYSVTYNNQGATTAQVGGDATYQSGSSLRLPSSPEKSGSTFKGWFLTPTGGSALGSSYTPLTPFGNIEIYAQWSLILTVTYQGAGGTSAVPTQANINEGGLLIVGSAMTRAGYTFGGWRDQSTTLYQPGVTYIAGSTNVVFTAQWSATSQTVTYSAGTGSGEVPTQSDVLTDGTFTVARGATLSKTGYTFVGWTDGTNNYTPGATYKMETSNVTLTANFLMNNYAVSYTTDGNGSISGSTPQTVDYGSNGSAVTATPTAGYRFTGWSDGVRTATRSEINVVANVFATAQFTAITYSVTYTGGSNGSIIGSSAQVIQYAGNTSPVTATPETGYRFSGWSDGNINATRSDLNITSALSVTANFELIPPLALEVLPIATPAPTPAPVPVVQEPAAAAPAPLILPQAALPTTKSSCDRPIVIDLSKMLASDGSSKVEVVSMPKDGNMAQTSATNWTFTPSKGNCSLGGNDSIVIKITDKNGAVITMTKNVVFAKQGDVPSKIRTGVVSKDENTKSRSIPVVPELLGFAFLLLIPKVRRKLKRNK